MNIGPDLKLVRGILRTAMQQINEANDYLSRVRTSADFSALRNSVGNMLLAVYNNMIAHLYFTVDLVAQVRALSAATEQAVTDHQRQIARIDRVRIPKLHNYASDRVNQAVRNLGHYADVQARHAYNRAHREVTGLRHSLLGVIHEATGRLRAEIHAAVTRADGQYAKARAQIRDALQAAERDATAKANRAQHQAVTQAGRNADHAAAGAWAGQWAAITAGVSAALATAGADFPELTRQLEAIVATEPATLAEAEAAAAAAVPPMLTALDECVMPNCRDLAPLRTVLSLMGDVIWVALLLAWLIQAVTDPEAWARETYDAFGPLTDGLLALMHQAGLAP